MQYDYKTEEVWYSPMTLASYINNFLGRHCIWSSIAEEPIPITVSQSKIKLWQFIPQLLRIPQFTNFSTPSVLLFCPLVGSWSWPGRVKVSPGWWCSIIAGLWRVYLSTYTMRPGLLLVWMFCSGGRAAFRWAARAGMPCGTLEIVIQEVLWSIRGSCWAVWGDPLAGVGWHSGPWPAVASLPVGLSANFMTFVPGLASTGLWVVSMGRLRRVWLAGGGRLPIRTPGSVPHFGTCWCSNCWDQIPRACHVFARLFTSGAPWCFLDFAPCIIHTSQQFYENFTNSVIVSLYLMYVYGWGIVSFGFWEITT